MSFGGEEEGELETGEEGEAEQEEIPEKEEEDPIESDAVNAGDYIYLLNLCKFANVKSCIEDSLFECLIKQQKEEDI